MQVVVVFRGGFSLFLSFGRKRKKRRSLSIEIIQLDNYVVSLVLFA
jgi:hypothetical protein